MSVYFSHGIFYHRKIEGENKKYPIIKCISFRFSHFHRFVIGVGFLLRKVGMSVTPTVEFWKNDDDTYTLKTSSTFKTTEIRFKLGEPFDEETLDGRKVKTVCTLEGNTLTQKQGGDKPSTIVRVFTEKDMTATMTVKDVVCTRHYVAV